MSGEVQEVHQRALKHTRSRCSCIRKPEWFREKVLEVSSHRLSTEGRPELEVGSPLAWVHAALLRFSGCVCLLAAARIFCTTYLQAGRNSRGKFQRSRSLLPTAA